MKLSGHWQRETPQKNKHRLPHGKDAEYTTHPAKEHPEYFAEMELYQSLDRQATQKLFLRSLLQSPPLKNPRSLLQCRAC
jgi:hypothetical protein